MNKGKEDGKREGQKIKSIEIAKVMLQDTNNYELISKYTGLSIEQIEQLQ
mgnify:FL=1